MVRLYFREGTDPDMAAVNVQNRIAQAQGLLPAEVVQSGVNVRKSQNSMANGDMFLGTIALLTPALFIQLANRKIIRVYTVLEFLYRSHLNFFDLLNFLRNITAKAR